MSTKNNYSVSVTVTVSEEEYSETSSAYFFLKYGKASVITKCL